VLYQLSYDPLCAPQRTASDRVLGVHLGGRLLKANEVRVYVVRGPSSNRKRPYGPWGRKIVQRAARIRTVVQLLFSL
jgi:hypothetical protein